MAFIEIKDLKFSYPSDDGEPITVIDGMDLNIEKGEFVAVLGRNGSGKSTLAKLMNFVLEAESGSVTVDGIRLAPDMSDDDLLAVRKKVGMVFQNPDNQLVATVVEEDIAFGPENIGVPPAEIRERVDKALETVGMSEYARHSPSRLSGGQKQRIAIAGVLAMMPECIIFDESTAMLDPSGRDEVMDTICRLNRERGMTVIMITHNMDEAVIADRVIVMEKGRIKKQGSPKEVFSDVPGMLGRGLAVPQVSELCYRLKKAGIDLPGGVLTEEEALELITAKLGIN